MAEETKLFYVVGDEQPTDGESALDLIVEALSWVQAAALWQQYYTDELDGDDTCSIWEIPTKQGVVGAYAWWKNDIDGGPYCVNVATRTTPITS